LSQKKGVFSGSSLDNDLLGDITIGKFRLREQLWSKLERRSEITESSSHAMGNPEMVFP
jgi:hypothetical protein